MKLALRLALVAAASIALAGLLTIVLFDVLMHASRSHTIEGLQYLVTTGIVSLTAGTAGLLAVSRYVPSLGLKIGAAWVFASVAALVNVIVTPFLMFAARTDFYILIITLLGFMTVSFAFAFIVATFTTGQIHELRESAVRLAAGDFTATVQVRGADEVADLARAFNHVATELGESFERQRQLEQGRRELVAAVSHDLRTPLASIRAMIEAVNDGVVSEPVDVHRYMGLIQQESERLGHLIDDLFELSRIESGSLELRLTSVPVDELVLETVDGLRIQAEEKGVDLEAISIGAVPSLTLDGPRIQRVLVNLIQNAIRHTPPGGSVRVEVGERDGHVHLSVADTGEGIAPADQPRLFDRFYRGEKSRSRESGGAGLGLAIARGIVEAHRGSIQVESAPGRGSKFIVSL